MQKTQQVLLPVDCIRFACNCWTPKHTVRIFWVSPEWLQYCLISVFEYSQITSNFSAGACCWFNCTVCIYSSIGIVMMKTYPPSEIHNGELQIEHLNPDPFLQLSSISVAATRWTWLTTMCDVLNVTNRCMSRGPVASELVCSPVLWFLDVCICLLCPWGWLSANNIVCD